MAIRYTVECQEGIVANYHGMVDMEKCSQLSKKLYRDMVDMLKQADGRCKLDEEMITLSMMVYRLGHSMNADAENPNNWENDGFPEFCSLIGPFSGFEKKPEG